MNGTWSPVKCPQAKMRYGDFCNASCAVGFELRGPSARRCSDQGSWTEDDVKVNFKKLTAFLLLPEFDIHRIEMSVSFQLFIDAVRRCHAAGNHLPGQCDTRSGRR